MSEQTGFIDLRLNQQHGENNESFWPSFTDIMTVIVMIFLIAMVVLLMRNMELVNQLRSTMEAERAAAELARTTGEEKESLALRLIDAESKLSEQRMQNLRLAEERDQQRQTISQQRALIGELSGERDQLQVQVQRLSDMTERLESDLSLSQEQYTSTSDTLTALQQRHETAQQELTALRQAFADQSAELEKVRSKVILTEEQYQLLQGDYDALKVKYDKLVRPARTPRGKFVVEVRYAKLNGKPVIEIKEPGQTGFRQLSRDALEQRLAALKAAQEQGLYVKVIIPENSGLSYNEAWEFTSQMHRGYDYYFQQ